MKYIFIIAIIAGGIYSFMKSPSLMDILQTSAETSVIDNNSGINVLNSVGGPGFDARSLSKTGKITIVEFYVSWCPACKKLERDYQRFLKARPDVAIRRVKMKDKWNIPWAKQQYGLDITGTPHVLIYDQQGELLIQDNDKDRSGYKLLYKWMDAEVRKKRV